MAIYVNGKKVAGFGGRQGIHGETGPQGPEGPQGPAGPAGSSIQSIVRTAGDGSPGTTDTYTITLTNGETSTFEVYNGADGQGTGDMSANVYDPQGLAQDIFAYVQQSLPTKVSQLENDSGFVTAGELPPSGVTAFNGRSGAVVPQAGDYTAELVGAATEAYVDSAIAAAILDSWGASY